MIRETDDSNTILYLSLLINDYKSIISVFKREKKYLFAAILAHKYQLEDEIEDIESRSGRKYISGCSNTLKIVEPLKSSVVVEDWNWPLVVSKSQLVGAKDVTSSGVDTSVNVDTTTTTTTSTTNNTTTTPTNTNTDNWDVDLDDLNIPTTTTTTTTTKQDTINTTLIPTRGPSQTEHWIRQNTPYSLVAAGEFELAMRLISKSGCLADMRPLKQLFIRIYESSRLYHSGLSITIDSSSSIIDTSLDSAHLKTTQGLFSEAIEEYRSKLQAMVLDDSSSKEKRRICVEYIIGLSMEIERRSSSDTKRAVELAAYFSDSDLLPEHKILALKVAMVQAYKAKCFKMASVFARRMLELQDNDKARQLIVACEGKDDEIVDVDYDEYYDGVDCESLCRISSSSASSKIMECKYCGAKYSSDIGCCKVCYIGKVN